MLLNARQLASAILITMQKADKRCLNDVAYWTYGKPNDQPLLMIHGFTGSHEGFDYIINQLKGYFVIVPDLPGFGTSPLTLNKYSIDELARVVNQFVVALRLETPPYLVSHSMGGLVAASMLTGAPELFQTKTVFVSPVATKVNYLDSRKIGELLGRLQFFVGKTLPMAGPKLVKSRLLSRLATEIIMTADQSEMKHKIRNHHYKNLDYISSIDYYLRLHIDINKKGAIDYAPAINKRFTALIVTGNKDNVTPLPTEKKLATALNNSKLEIIDGVGHLLHYERPKEVAAAIDAFLA